MFKLFGGKKCLARKHNQAQTVDNEPVKIATTLQIPPRQRAGSNAGGAILLPEEPPFGLRPGATSLYAPVPVRRKTDQVARRCCWRIELHGLGTRVAPMGFDILGDVVLGRNADGTAEADIDFEAHGGGGLGVSRRHAMLRPSHNALFLMDLSSTNGTCHNGAQLAASTVRALHDGDIISLGKLTFRVKLIDWPSRSNPKQ